MYVSVQSVAVCCSVLRCVADVPVAAAVVVIAVDLHSSLTNSVCVLCGVWCLRVVRACGAWVRVCMYVAYAALAHYVCVVCVYGVNACVCICVSFNRRHTLIYNKNTHAETPNIYSPPSCMYTHTHTTYTYTCTNISFSHTHTSTHTHQHARTCRRIWNMCVCVCVCA